MTADMDARLREYAARWGAAHDVTDAGTNDGPLATLSTLGASPPPQPHRRRTAFAVAASIAVVAAIAATTWGLTRDQGRSPGAASAPSTSTHSAADVVPWSSAGVRADTAVVPELAKVGAPIGLRGCANIDFSVVPGSAHSAAADAGWLRTSFVLRATAMTPCAVPHGYVQVDLLTDAGVALPNDAGAPSAPPTRPSALLVRPGQLVFGEALWAVYEGRAPRPAQLVINLNGVPNPTGLRVPLDSVTVPPHPRAPSNIGPWRSGSYGSIQAVSNTGALASLSATVMAPVTIANGDVLHFTVTLTNPTATAVAFTDCPDFVERLDVIPSKTATTVGFRGPLNCAAAPKAVGAGQSVTFGFELPTAGEVPGPGRLIWQLVTGDSAAVSAQAQLTVRR